VERDDWGCCESARFARNDPSPIWDDSWVDDVNFANRPTIEAWFRKKLFEDLMVADLDVSASHAKAPQVGLGVPGPCVQANDCGHSDYAALYPAL